MKKFYSSSSIGDAGLFYLGFKINKDFGFPYRIQPSADIGIDAEIELVNEDGSSTGIIIKAQVKTKEKKITGDFTEYLKEKDLKYWDNIPMPVLYFVVDLESEKIYYKIISSDSTVEETNSKSEGRYKIEFSVENNCLTKKDKNEWLEKFKLIEFHSISKYIEDSNQIIKTIDPHNCISESGFDKERDKIEKVEIMIEKLLSLEKLYPWKFDKQKIESILILKKRLRKLKSDLKFNYGQSIYN